MEFPDILTGFFSIVERRAGPASHMASLGSLPAYFRLFSLTPSNLSVKSKRALSPLVLTLINYLSYSIGNLGLLAASLFLNIFTSELISLPEEERFSLYAPL